MAGKNAKAKTQRARRQAAARRKDDAREVLAGVGLDLGDDLFGIGVMFKHLGPSQAAYFGVNAINDLCGRVVGLDFALFVEQPMRPSVVPSCPVFGIDQLASLRKPLITTSIRTCLAALATRAPIVVHYVLVPEFAEPTDLSAEETRRVFCDPRVRVLARSPDYVGLLKNRFGIEAHYVPDFQITEMLKFIESEVRLSACNAQAGG